MFCFPVTVPVLRSDSVIQMIVSVAIDELALVKPLLDNAPPFGVESSSDLIPLTELVFVDGRRLPVLEAPHIINCYLDAYTSIEDFYTASPPVWHEGGDPGVGRTDNVIPLFGTKPPCVTSEGSTPA